MVAVAVGEKDIQGMRIAGQKAASVLEMIEPFVQPGISTEELDQRCHQFIVEELECVPAPLNYGSPPFPKSICTSLNHVVCHGIPSSSKTLKNGDSLNIDITVITKEGYFGDTSKMFFAGQPSVLSKRLSNITRECLFKGIEKATAGNKLGDIGNAIQDHAERSNFSVVREFCGHGILKVFHDEPQVLHYGNPNEGMTLEEGMCFTVEPMINAGKRHIKILPDQWTAVTKDHKLSAQWEHTIMVTGGEPEIFTLRKDETNPNK